jgi:hypothetical protein
MCWGTFESKYCNEVDKIPMVSPLNPMSLPIDMINAAALNVYPQTRAVAIANYALSRQPAVTTALIPIANQCYGDPGMPSMCAEALGDGVVVGAGYKNCLNQSV